MDKLNHNSDDHQDLITVTDFKITSADTDREARLRPGALFNYLAHGAYLSADNLGFGFEHLKEHNLFWVLSRLEMHIQRPLMWNEVVEIETWPKDIEGILYIRDFNVRDRQGEIVVRAGTSWLAIDMETKRPKRKESFDSDLFSRLSSKQALSSPPEKLPGIHEGERFDVRSTYFDIDLNRHVTSSRYIDWMMDTISSEFHKSRYPSIISMNYVKETMEGTIVDIFRKEEPDHVFFFEGIHAETEKSAFRGKIRF